jgi:hypothetical protein
MVGLPELCNLGKSRTRALRKFALDVGRMTSFITGHCLNGWYMCRFSLNCKWTVSTCNVVREQPRVEIRIVFMFFAPACSVLGVVAFALWKEHEVSCLETAAGSWCVRFPCYMDCGINWNTIAETRNIRSIARNTLRYGFNDLQLVSPAT